MRTMQEILTLDEVDVQTAYLLGKIDALKNLEDYFRTFRCGVIKLKDLVQALKSIRLNLEGEG